MLIDTLSKRQGHERENTATRTMPVITLERLAWPFTFFLLVSAFFYMEVAPLHASSKQWGTVREC